MSRKILSSFVLLLVFMTVTAVSSFAQEQPKTFKLSRGELSPQEQLGLENEAKEQWVPHLKKGAFELSFTLGFLDLSPSVLKHDQIIYKWSESGTYWGDVDFKGASAFSPSLRVNYNVTKWFAVEFNGNFSTCDYTTSVENRVRRSNLPDTAPDVDEPVLGEFDAEARSLATFNGSVSAIWYPFNMGDDKPGGKRFYPYVSGGIGQMYYNMNSDFIDESASTMNLSVGAGMRFIVDKSVSLRAELVMHHNTIEFLPSADFQSLDSGANVIPLNEYPEVVIDDRTVIDEKVVKEFASSTLNSLQINLGFQVMF